MVFLQNTFEGGTVGATVTVANSGGILNGNAWDAVNSGGTLQYDNSVVAHGNVSCEIATTSAALSFLEWTTSLGGTFAKLWFRAYFYFAANPTNQHRLLTFKWDGTLRASDIEVTTGGLIVVHDSAGTAQLTSVATIPLNQWFRLEGFTVGNASTGQVSFSLYNVLDSTTVTETQTSGATLNTGGVLNELQYGIGNPGGTANVSFNIDEPAVSSVGAIGPYAATPVSGADASAATVDNASFTVATNIAGADASAATVDTGSITVAIPTSDTGHGTDLASVTVLPQFPQALLPIKAEVQLGTNQYGWNDFSSLIYQRDVMNITRGRANEASQITAAQLSMTVNNKDTRFTLRAPNSPWYGQLHHNSQMRVSLPVSLVGGSNYLRMDDASNVVYTPDAPKFQITGSMDLIMDYEPEDYSTHMLASKWAFGSVSWEWYIDNNGCINFLSTPGFGIVNLATSTVPLPYLGRITVRATINATAGTVQFFTATNINGPFTQLGTTIQFKAPIFITPGVGSNIVVGNDPSLTGDGLDTNSPRSPRGKIYEFAMYSGVSTGQYTATYTPTYPSGGSTLVANPKFYLLPANTTFPATFQDQQGNTWNFGGSCLITDRLYRFHGEMNSFPQNQDVTGSDVWVPITAGGPQQRLAQGNTPLNSPMYRYYARLPNAATGAVAPYAYWPAEDGSAAISLASAVAGGLPMTVNPSAANGTSTLASSSVFNCSEPLAEIGAAFWSGPVTTPAGGSWTDNVVRFLFNEAAGSIPDKTLLCTVYTTGTVRRFDLVYNTANGGSLTINGNDGTTTNLFSIGSITGIDGVPMAVSMELVAKGSNINYDLAILTTTGTSKFIGGTLTGASIGAVYKVVFNPTAANLSTSAVTIGHVSVQPVWDNLVDLTNPIKAWNGEPAGARYARLCFEEGINYRIWGFPNLSVPMGPQGIQTILALLQEIENTDQGLQYEPCTTVGLGYVVHSALYNQTAKATASYTAGALAAGFGSTSDDLLVVNDVTANNLDSSSSRQVRTTGNLSVANIGRIDTSFSVNAAYDSIMPSIANWKLWTRTVDDDRYPAIPFDMARPETPIAIPLLYVGSYLNIPNTPPNYPPGPIRQLTVGFTEVLGPAGIWTIECNCIPEVPYEVFTIGTSRLESSGTTLHANINSAVTSFQADIPTGPLWTLLSTDFPFDILMGGERMTVTSITGSSTPQTFNVTRSVNGVVKSHSTGEAVTLFNQNAIAL